MAQFARRPAHPSDALASLPPLSPWPLAGTADFARVNVDWRRMIADRLESDVRRHVMTAWFPRCLDRDRGGFLCDFDDRWRADGPQQRMLEFQARQTRTAARLGLAFPADSHWPEYALHGLRYLRDVMWDRELGGWFWMVDAAGSPLADQTKHAHGTAYVLGACLEVFRLTGDKESLAMAQAVFDWLEAHLHDSTHGGYMGWATRDGRPISEEDAAGEPLGHAAGLKDANVHSDLLEAFTLLFEITPNDLLAERLAEVYELLTTRFATPAGSMHYLLYRDLAAVPTLERFGYPVQTAFRLPPAAAVLGWDVAGAVGEARRMVDHATALAWDGQRGGLIEAGPAASPHELSGTSLRVPARPWWIQTEALKAFLLLGLLDGHDSQYLGLFERELETVNSEFVDSRFGGWVSVARSDLSTLGRRLGRGVRKGHMWKDASHETDFYLSAIRMLRGIAEHEALTAI